MPIIRSAKKALRQSERRRVQNLKKKRVYKGAIKDLKAAVALGDVVEAQKLLNSLYKAVDKAAKTNVIKKNKAARLKSRLSKRLARSKK